MVRRNRLLSIAAPAPTPEERLEHLNSAISAIRDDEVSKLVATIPVGVDVKAMYLLRHSRPSKRALHFQASLLHVAVINNALACLKFLLHLGAPKEAPESSLGDHPLHLAARLGCRSALDMLMRDGARLSSTNHLGDTALHIAAARGDVCILLALLKAGAHYNIKNKYGDTAFIVAMIAGTPSTLACASLIDNARQH